MTNWEAVIEPTRTHKPLKSQLFELSSKPLEGFKNGKIIYWLRLDTQDHVPEVLSWYKFFWMILWCAKQGHIFGVPLFVQPACLTTCSLPELHLKKVTVLLSVRNVMEEVAYFHTLMFQRNYVCADSLYWLIFYVHVMTFISTSLEAKLQQAISRLHFTKRMLSVNYFVQPGVWRRSVSCFFSYYQSSCSGGIWPFNRSVGSPENQVGIGLNRCGI